MKQFKYSLDKSSKKFICPKCTKRTFVKYIETETGSYLSDTFGRCDRETNCGYHSTPSGDFKNSVEVIYTPPPKPSFHDPDLLIQSGRNFKKNNFILFLKTLFSDAEVNEAILKYLIGTSKHWSGATIFWQIDNNEKIRHGKIMLFNSETGKRVKDQHGKALINSARSVLKLKNFTLNQCLFGLHLVNETKQKTIALVEGEKTAVIMSLFKPQYTWMATGGKGGLKSEFLKPIKQYKIVAFPDKSEYKDWLNKAGELNKSGFNIVVNNWLEQQCNYEAGTDLADVYLTELKAIEHPKVEFNYTETEKAIHRIEHHTPEIWELIKTFDLVDSNNNEINKIKINHEINT
ncbi:MAG: DUF6371 domain-containing protein [Flavobacterium sp. JAD_PAG50586_2]|nr:MAG: DUF6371 domain-containing protein [Flavobacterium sp. JAD_PAG50586_2]